MLEDVSKNKFNNFSIIFNKLVRDKCQGKETMKSISKLLDISERSLKNYLDGTIPKIETILKISDVFDINISTLFGETCCSSEDVEKIYGLNKEAQDKLKLLVADSKNLSIYTDKYKEAVMEIEIINAFIETQNLYDSMSNRISKKILSMKRDENKETEKLFPKLV